MTIEIYYNKNYLVLLHSTWHETVFDLNLLCSCAWNQTFIFLVEMTGNLSVGLSFLQYLIGFFPVTFTKNLSPFLQRPGSLLSMKNFEHVSFISVQPAFNS